jgi:hypothetical protein
VRYQLPSHKLPQTTSHQAETVLLNRFMFTAVLAAFSCVHLSLDDAGLRVRQSLFSRQCWLGPFLAYTPALSSKARESALMCLVSHVRDW